MKSHIKPITDRLPKSGYWRDISWAASGTALAQAINLLSLPLLTRLYTPSDFAALNIFTQGVAFAAILVTFRYEYAIQLPRTHFAALAVLYLVGSLAVLGSIVLTPLMLLAFNIGRAQVESIGVGGWIVLAPMTAALLSLSIAYQHMAQRQVHYRQAGIAEALARIGYFAVAVVGHFIASGALGLICAVGAAYLIKILILKHPTVVRATKPAPLSVRAWNKALRSAAHRHRGLATSMVSSHLVATATGLAPSIYLATVFGADTLGQFALVVSTTYLPSALIGSAIGQVYNQRAAALWSNGESFANLWRSTNTRLAMFGIPMYLALAAAAPWLYPFVFGPQWETAGALASVMSLAAYFSYQTTPLDRSSLVVGAWRYLPAWHVARLVTTLLVIVVSAHRDWTAFEFVVALTLQMTALYAVDLVAERHFAGLDPATARSRRVKRS